MKNAKRTKAFLKSAAENAAKTRRNGICNAFVLRSVLYSLLFDKNHSRNDGWGKPQPLRLGSKNIQEQSELYGSS